MATSSTTTAAGVRPTSARGQLLRAGLVGLLTGLVLTVAARLVVGAFVAVDPAVGPFQWLPIVGSVVVAGIGATVVYALLGRYTARPRRNFLAASALVFALMLVPLLVVGPSLGITGGLTWALFGLHVTTAVGIVGGLLWTLARY